MLDLRSEPMCLACGLPSILRRPERKGQCRLECGGCRSHQTLFLFRRDGVEFGGLATSTNDPPIVVERFAVALSSEVDVVMGEQGVLRSTSSFSVLLVPSVRRLRQLYSVEYG